MVSYDGYAGPDMKFVNNSKDAVAIRARFADQKLTISIVGVPILGENERWYMKSEKVAELDPPQPNYEENQTLEPGVEKVVKQPVNGSRWVTNLVKEKDGKVISDEMLHKSTYKGKPATIQRNTSGVVVPPPEASQESTVAPETVPESSTKLLHKRRNRRRRRRDLEKPRLHRDQGKRRRRRTVSSSLRNRAGRRGRTWSKSD